MNRSHIAALIRGLCINLTGKPYFVVTGDSGAIPKGAMFAALPPFMDAENLPSEKVAEIIHDAYTAWIISSRNTAVKLKENELALPSCVVVGLNDSKAFYWIDSDWDSARKRLAEQDASPITASIAANATAMVDPTERAAVVKNRIALVTGGAQGIGEEIVRNLAAAGAAVFIADLNLEGAQKLADAINAAEQRTAAMAVQVNVANEPSAEAMVNTVAEKAGGLDLCISNAGVLKAGSVLEQELADFKLVTDINYTGFFIVSKFAGRLLKAQHLTAQRWKTDIIQINSKSGLEGSNKNGAYAGGKFGGIGLVASFAMELIEYNVKVNAICPGNFLDGSLWSHPEKGLFVQYLQTGKVVGAKSIADVRAFYESKVPMKRGCTGKDLVRAVYYIVEQEYETGQAIPVTGGQVMLH